MSKVDNGTYSYATFNKEVIAHACSACMDSIENERVLLKEKWLKEHYYTKFEFKFEFPFFVKKVLPYNDEATYEKYKSYDLDDDLSYSVIDYMYDYQFLTAKKLYALCQFAINDDIYVNADDFDYIKSYIVEDEIDE